MTSLFFRLGKEKCQLVALLASYFLIIFIYHIVKDLKDTLLITAQGSGAEVIPVLKLWFILPAAIIGTRLTTRLIQRWGAINALTLVASVLAGYYVLFALFLYPYGNTLCFVDTEALPAYIPSGVRACLVPLRFPLFTVFYICSELWSVLILSFLFWIIAHQVTSFAQAKKHYPWFLALGSSAGMFSGYFSQKLSTQPFRAWIPLGQTAWEQSLILMALLIVVSAVTFIICMRRFVGAETTSTQKPAKKKKSYSFTQSLQEVWANRQLRSIMLMVLGYNITVSLVEVVWKDHVRQVCSDAASFNSVMNEVTFWVGFSAALIALVTPYLYQKFAWSRIALVTPTLLLGTSACFLFSLAQPHLISPYLGVSASMVPVLLGGLQVITCRVAKYTVFDSSKEVCFNQLPDELRLQGKGMIDVVVSRCGKSGSSLFCQNVVLIGGSLAACGPLLLLLPLIVLPFSLQATRSLGQDMDERAALSTT